MLRRSSQSTSTESNAAADENGTLYVADAGNQNGNGGGVYRIDRKGNVRKVADKRTASLTAIEPKENR